jgi:hypothetical protein
MEHAKPGDLVLDPFCGRGTTNYAARLLGLTSVGLDSSPVATAITSAKLVNTTAEAVSKEAKRILGGGREVAVLPSDGFWDLAFHSTVLQGICRLRESLLEDCESPERKALRGIVLGALHGPKNKGQPSYFSNQSPRTYAPKPAYATRFWLARNLTPPKLDLLEIIRQRARRYYSEIPLGTGTAYQADSRMPNSFRVANSLQRTKGRRAIDWIITSPPYYGMRTYLPDQWLRNWFVGGPPTVDYSARGQLEHRSPEAFMEDLRLVWRNVACIASRNARLVVRFGGITDRKADPKHVILGSLHNSGWSVRRIQDAGSAQAGKRQADSFLRKRTRALGEIDIWAALGG